MMKKILPFLLVVAFYTSFSFAGFTYYLNTGDYGYGLIISNDDVLIVQGGGADVINVGSYGQLEVHSTSSPENGDWDSGGIRDIGMTGHSHLEYLGGYADIIDVASNATADLRGGSINHISSAQYTYTTTHINIYCQPGWSWLYRDENGDGILEIGGIMGLWQDGISFSIDFIDDDNFGYPPVYTNINVIPEPATLALLGLGGLLLRRKQ